MVVGLLEELKARGFKNFIVLGSCGVLDQSIQADKIILPSSALRDEGTSYHYAPASDEIVYEQSLLLTMEKPWIKLALSIFEQSLGPQMPSIVRQLLKSNED